MSDEQAKQLKAADTYVSIMSNAPKVILENVSDAQNLEVLMRFDSFYLETRHSGALEGNYHNMGLQMAELPNYISDPDAIIRNDKGRLNLISAIDNNKNRLISIELNTVKDINSKYNKYNLVVSVFHSKDRYINNLIKKSASLEYEKEDLPQVNHQLHKSLEIINGKSSNTNVSQIDTDVNNNSMQDKTKYSLRDSDYEKAVNTDDLEKAQKLVDEAAVHWGALTDDNGKPLRVYHGTTNQEGKSVWNDKTKTFDTNYRKFTVFKKQYDEQSGYFFSSDIDNAGEYGSTLYEVYFKMNKPLIIDCKNSNYSVISYNGQIKDTYEWAEYAQNNGYDGVIFNNISDGVGYADLQYSTDDYVVFNSSQIKSAETVTYDDHGNIIPLDKRFSFYQDIRYSKRELNQTERLLKENAQLQYANKLLKEKLQLTKGHKLKQSNIKSVAKKLVEVHGAYDIDRQQLEDRLTALYTYIANAGRDIDDAYIWTAANDIGRSIAKASSIKDTTYYDNFKDLKKWIRDTAITVSKEVRQEVSAYEIIIIGRLSTSI
ncbi:MAG: hypothetical protein NC397_03975 [Clostridium sp.]|nr:hypothetical protein [Clostridium sp.]